MLNNYFIWLAVYKQAYKISWEYRNARFKYTKTYLGSREAPTPITQCFKLIRQFLPEPMAIEFMRIHTKTESQSQVKI